MIAFDTNVLLRLLLDDDARQAWMAQALLDHAVARPDKVLLPDIVLCELEWVLNSVYEVPKAEIIETLRRLLDAEEFAFLDRATVAGALNGYEGGSADLSDYLIGATAARAGAATTYTFDRALRAPTDSPCPGSVCCFSESVVGSPRQLVAVFRSRIYWKDGAIR